MNKIIDLSKGHIGSTEGTLEELFNDTNDTIKDSRISFSTNFTKASINPYIRGMFISISNHKKSHYDIEKTFRKQYKSVLKAVGIKVGGDDIHKQKGLPIRATINGLIEKGIPIAIAGIHDYENEDKDDGITYQHTHLLIYNIHHFLPNDKKKLASCIKRVRATLGRYVGKKFRRDGVDVRPVGTYKHYTNEQFDDDSFYDYLHNPSNSPNRDCLINYITKNRHNPDVLYPLTYLYHNNDYLPVNLSNRTLTTN